MIKSNWSTGRYVNDVFIDLQAVLLIYCLFAYLASNTPLVNENKANY